LSESLLIIVIAAGAFVATNIDNLALLVMFLLRYRDQRLVVATAYLTGVSLLGIVSFTISLLASTAPVHYLGLLGIVPISIGAMGIWRLARGSVAQKENLQNESISAAAVFVVTLSTQLGNGTDTVLTFGSLFADSVPGADQLIMVTMAVMAVLFLWLANYCVKHPVFSDMMQRHAHRVTPFLLILVGAYILANTGTDLMPG
jgi:cadmium resistance protein CadD (predicted permease)